MENRQRIHVRIFGKVQGVFYREETRKAAIANSVKGWVRNLPDGSVEAIFEGKQQDVQHMADWCRQGSPLSRVESVVINEQTDTEGHRRFRVRYDG